MPRKKYIFKNSFHGTEGVTTLKEGETKLTRSQLSKINKKLCGKGTGCKCYGKVLKVEGPQSTLWKEEESIDKLGWFETIKILGEV